MVFSAQRHYGFHRTWNFNNAHYRPFSHKPLPAVPIVRHPTDSHDETSVSAKVVNRLKNNHGLHAAVVGGVTALVLTSYTNQMNSLVGGVAAGYVSYQWMMKHPNHAFL